MSQKLGLTSGGYQVWPRNQKEIEQFIFLLRYIGKTYISKIIEARDKFEINNHEENKAKVVCVCDVKEKYTISGKKQATEVFTLFRLQSFHNEGDLRK